MAGGIAILGTGSRLPTRYEDNVALCARLDVTPEWIVEKTGIEGRYLAGPDDKASDYATDAARAALDMAGLGPGDVDMVVACTFSGDYLFPPLSAAVQRNLGMAGGHVFDLQANCAGFVSGLTAAADRMAADDEVRTALVVGVEFSSRYVDGTDANTAIYLSDGAGAVVLGRADPARGILASAFHTDTANYESVRLRGGGSSFPVRRGPHPAEIALMEMNGIATWKQAITHLPPTIRRACAKAGVPLAEVDFMVFHQANLRLIEYVMKKMGVAADKTHCNVQRIGNTGSASLAIALDEAVRAGRLADGDAVVFAAVGAGFTFGANVWRWHGIGGARP